MQMPDEQFELVPRRGLAVYISSHRVIRALRHYGRVVPSALPDLDPDVADLASTGLYKTHDEDD